MKFCEDVMFKYNRTTIINYRYIIYIDIKQVGFT